MLEPDHELHALAVDLDVGPASVAERAHRHELTAGRVGDVDVDGVEREEIPARPEGARRPAAEERPSPEERQERRAEGEAEPGSRTNDHHGGIAQSLSRLPNPIANSAERPIVGPDDPPHRPGTRARGRPLVGDGRGDAANGERPVEALPGRRLEEGAVDHALASGVDAGRDSAEERFVGPAVRADRSVPRRARSSGRGRGATRCRSRTSRGGRC